MSANQSTSKPSNDQRDSMTIRRSPHDGEHPYFPLRRATAQDEALSWEALGVLTYLLSKPDDWQITVADLQKRRYGEKRKNGRERVQRILRELRSTGYLTLEYVKIKTGVQGTSYFIHETPVNQNPERRVSRLPGFPESQGNPLLHNIESDLQNTDSLASEIDELPETKERTEYRKLKSAEARLSLSSKKEPPQATKTKSPPSRPPKPMPMPTFPKEWHDRVFDTLKANVAQGNGSPGYIGKLKKALIQEAFNNNPRTLGSLPDDLLLMYIWYDKKGPQGMEKPAKPDTIVTWLNRWRNRPEAKMAEKPAHDPNCPICKGKGHIRNLDENGKLVSVTMCPGVPRNKRPS